MSDQQDRLPRRQLLQMAGITVAAGGLPATASAAVSETVTGSTDSSRHPQSLQETDDPNGEAQYADVYEETIDNVVLVTVGGPNEDGDVPEDAPEGMGSGFILEDGYVVTNEHVVTDATDVELQFRDEQWATASVIGTDSHSDLAILEIDGDAPDAVDGLSFVDETPTIGQEVLALGNPLGFDASITQGIVSGVDRSLPSPTGFSIPAAIQTDAALNPGNSGGPLVTLEREVAGIVFAGASQTIGFAIAAQLADRVVPDLIDDGEYAHPYMGVGVLPVDPVIAEANDLEEPQGVLVMDVEPDGPAGGVFDAADDGAVTGDTVVPTGGDVIVAIDDEPIPNQDRLSSFLALETAPGDTVSVEIIRDGDSETVDLELAERPDVDLP
ncbi:PDZ domain-containing protein [Natronolimnobius sp. AArcel1]|uniref:S1C family serine protease n=1 Tax=Natronolimnobius sp. AArcel1 TaxID=1679093 RepID=UPI0013EB9DAF|nr:trypsin-like peptidase domain-containing protein [Natronolimnobius sp. AArcel1]NGM69575.1 PDZ domain-containing protein [Natronolimnobius sp. AArcel1]